MAKRSSSTLSRASGSSAISALAASMRNFGLRRARRRPAAQPRQLLAQQLPAARVARGRLAVALGAREHVGRVAALVLVDGRRRRPPTSAVQTASRNQRSWVTTSIEPRRAARWRGEPVDALDVEVVGRLVEQQQLGAVEQQLGQRDAPPLAAGQRRRSACRGRRGKRRSSTPPSSPSSTRAEASRRRPTRGRRGRRRAPARIVSRRASRSSPWPSSASVRAPPTPGDARPRRAARARRSAAAASTCRRRCARRCRSGRPRRRRA